MERTTHGRIQWAGPCVWIPRRSVLPAIAEISLETYYKSQHLAEFAKIAEGSPDLGRKFFDYYAAVFADGALTAREKSLIALAVAHAVQCPYCIDAYTQDCQQKGADFEQMTEALHVAVAIRGGASLVHGMQMRDQVKKSGMC
jgi:alkylhydroperoxidase/carboxymuconolactone decarboxylase family protein